MYPRMLTQAALKPSSLRLFLTCAANSLLATTGHAQTIAWQDGQRDRLQTINTSETTYPALPYVLLLIGAICVWNVANGWRSGVMRVGIGTIGIDRDRSVDPKGYWIYFATNAAVVTACLLLILDPGLA